MGMALPAIGLRCYVGLAKLMLCECVRQVTSMVSFSPATNMMGDSMMVTEACAKHTGMQWLPIASLCGCEVLQEGRGGERIGSGARMQLAAAAQARVHARYDLVPTVSPRFCWEIVGCTIFACCTI